jgi:hypothetical protein
MKIQTAIDIDISKNGIDITMDIINYQNQYQNQ